MDIKKSEITLKPNYILIPCTRTDDMDEFNQVLFKYNNKGYYHLNRSQSGGIQLKDLKLPAYDFKVNYWGCELLIIDDDGCFRLQFRNNLTDDEDVNDDVKKITGRECLFKFRKELKEFGYEMTDWAIKNGDEIKETIPKAMVDLDRESYAGITFENCHHIDMHSSHPAGMKEFRPEWGKVIDKWYYLKEHAETKNDRTYYKALLNLTWGSCQSKYFNSQYADIAKYALERTNREVTKMANWLKENDRVVILYNTDGIWFTGDRLPLEMQSDELGCWSEDYHDCKFRAKSSGCYEFEGYDKYDKFGYHPVVRGKTLLDDKKDRRLWQWGDIYNYDCEVKRYKASFEKGIEDYGK